VRTFRSPGQAALRSTPARTPQRLRGSRQRRTWVLLALSWCTDLRHHPRFVVVEREAGRPVPECERGEGEPAARDTGLEERGAIARDIGATVRSSGSNAPPSMAPRSGSGCVPGSTTSASGPRREPVEFEVGATTVETGEQGRVRRRSITRRGPSRVAADRVPPL
jgi:hypothetical protein